MNLFPKSLAMAAMAVFAVATAAPAPETPLSRSAEASRAAFASLEAAKKGGAAARIEALRLPGTVEYLSSPQAMMGFHALSASFEKFPDRSKEAFVLYSDLLPKIDHLRGWDGYLTTYLARSAKNTGDRDLAERIRRESASLIRRTIEKHDFESPKLGSSNVVDFFKLDLAHLEGSGMRGQLVGHRAPELKFLWASEPGINSLSDLKGQVVVLDFWATWCKPCVGLFPKIREIAQSYDGKPVVFVGVTSVQGWSVDPVAGRIDCKGDPKKETSLMPGLMKKLGVTWTVAFAEKDCFNPDFDIMSIPHMAIVDQGGVVRFDGVEPDDLKSKIDELLTGKTKGAR